MTALHDAQVRFTRMLAEHLQWARMALPAGQELVVAEVYRPPETAKLYALQGRGSLTSLHCDKLAADILLFENGELVTETERYTVLGEHWESLGGAWGGRFRDRPDGNHMSLEFEGRR